MFDANQLVAIKWSNRTRNHYEKIGYVFTNYGDIFYVKACDLTKGSKAKVKIVCDFCKETYYTDYASFSSRSNQEIDACKKCKIHKQWSKTKDKRAEEKFDILAKICTDNNYELITDKSEFVNSLTTIEYICSKHGLQRQSLDNMIHGHGCWFCACEKRGLNYRHSVEYIKSVIECCNGNKLLNQDEYVGSNTHNLKIECGKCGNIYITSLSHYIRNSQTRCKSCAQSESVGEMKIRIFLENNDIAFIQEKTFKNCIDKKRLPFDFYLPKHNLIIEFDGQHHFYETGFGNHELTKKHDEVKNQYCKDNDIELLRIPYWEGNNIESILSKQLNL